LDAFAAALFAGRLGDERGLLQVAQAARTAPAPVGQPQSHDLLLDGLALRFTEGYPAAIETLTRALRAFCDEDGSVEQGPRWLFLASIAAGDLWDDESWRVLAARHVKISRAVGALSDLPTALHMRVFVHLFAGELEAVTELTEEAQALREATRIDFAKYGCLGLAAWQGDEEECANLVKAIMSEVVPRGEGLGVSITQWASAILANGLGRYGDAMAAGQTASEFPHEFCVGNWVLPELIEAAVRSGAIGVAEAALEQLSESTQASGTNWGLGVEARCRALLSEGETAERLYQAAIEHLAASRARFDLARAHLLYGEWLRRENRRLEAREQLRTSHEMFTAMGVEAFAERARRELLATGETARKRTVETINELTAQEAQIARLASDGRTNPEIGAELFISPRTVEWHLRKLYPKLGITSRKELRGALSNA
jgi:DNA-binding CsgD family transcriptional regulator